MERLVSGRRLAFESLEERRLLAASHGELDFASKLYEAEQWVVADALGSAFDSPGQNMDLTAETSLQVIELPDQHENTLEFSIRVDGETYSITLERYSHRGENFQVLVQGDDGALVELDPGPDNTYRGVVAENPNLNVSAVIVQGGLHAVAVDTSTGIIAWELTPDPAGRDGSHRLSLPLASSTELEREAVIHEADSVLHSSENNSYASILSRGAATGDEASDCDEPTVGGGVVAFGSGDAVVLNPVSVMQAEIAFDVSYWAYVNRYGSNIQSVLDQINIFISLNTAGSMGTIWLRDALVEHVLGRVVIRTSQAADPYDAQGLGGASGTDSTLLSAFRSEWNNNPGTYGTSHDLAHLMLGRGGGGLAWVGTVTGSYRYSMADGGSRNAWLSFARHEVGHNWGLGHGHGRAENDVNGAQIGIMWDPSLHHEFNTDEAATVLARRNAVASNLTDIGSFAGFNVTPYGNRDDLTIAGEGTHTLDVLPNDYDANNDPLYISRLAVGDSSPSTTSPITTVNGGLVSILHGSGSQGQDLLSYTAPMGFSGIDSFHYWVSDETAQQSAIVTVNIVNPAITVDLSENIFRYDLGTSTSPVFTNSEYTAVRISPETIGDVTWSLPVSATDRGTSSGANDFNRDFVYGSAETTFSHRLEVGTWNVTVNLSDPNTNLDNMYVRAEGVTMLSDIDRPAGENGTLTFQVFVDDGFIDLTFGDADASNRLWAVNRIVLDRFGDPPVFVDLNADSYAYDFGTSDSPVFSNSMVQAVRIAPTTFGDVNWGSAVMAEDRGVGNAYNRDLVWSTNETTWTHRIENGRWRVTVNMSDAVRDLDNMYVLAEGLPGLTNLNHPIGTNPTLSFETTVTDSVLELTFGDIDENNPLWALNRVVLTQLEAFIPPLLPGDFNRDDVVDIADYTMWRDTLGQSVTTPYDDADASGNGVIDTADYQIWRGNFGASVITTTLINGSHRNGEFNLDNAADAQSIGGTGEPTINLDRDRALRQITSAGQGVAIPGWDLTRVSLNGGNPAIGFDGDFGLAPVAGLGPGQTGQAFVNSGSVNVTTESISHTFFAGDVLELSYRLGSDNLAATVQTTVSLVFDEGLPSEFTHTFDVQTAIGLGTPAIFDEYRMPAAASTLTAAFLLDGVQTGVRTLLDSVILEVRSSITSAAYTGAGEISSVFAAAVEAPCSRVNGGSTTIVAAQLISPVLVARDTVEPIATTRIHRPLSLWLAFDQLLTDRSHFAAGKSGSLRPVVEFRDFGLTHLDWNAAVFDRETTGLEFDDLAKANQEETGSFESAVDALLSSDFTFEAPRIPTRSMKQ